jgi:mono/diheme cytochrome c family protein
MHKLPGLLSSILLVSVLVVSGCSSPASSPIFSTTPVTSSMPNTTVATIATVAPSPTTTVATTNTTAPSQTTTVAPTTTATPSPTATMAIDAAQLYSLNCASCHGADRLGVQFHLLTTSALAHSEITTIIYIINHGHGSDMPGYANLLTPDQISALANYLKTTVP